MKKFVAERNPPGGERLSAEEMQVISIPFIEEALKEQARPGIFPVNIISEINTFITPQPIISLESGCSINQY